MGGGYSNNATKLALAVYNFGRSVGDNSVAIAALYMFGNEGLKTKVFLSDAMTLTSAVQFYRDPETSKLTVVLESYTYFCNLTILAAI